MNWDDNAFIISKKKFRENAIILDIFTCNHGKVSGIVYGGNSRKVKNYLQLLNKIFVIYNSKSENKIGYFKTELINPISPLYFDNKIKILCINSLSSLLKAVLPENQPYEKIYKSLCHLLENFSDSNWLKSYLDWEINLINNLGFGFKIDESKYKDLHLNKTINVKLDNINYEIPSFLISNHPLKIDEIDIYKGLNFSRNLMENKFFIPNNIRFPYSRKLLEKQFL